MPKQPQQAVNYRRGYPLKQCAVCRMYVKRNAAAAFGSCTDVSGSITPFGLCDIWHSLNNPWGNKLNGQSRAAIEQLYDQARGGSGQ